MELGCNGRKKGKSGKTYLNRWAFQLIDASAGILQDVESKTGFRRVRLVMNEGAWDEPKGFPKTRSVPPMQMEINGRKILCRGTNWVNPEVFPGIITRARYNELLDFAREANFNILRFWGGEIVNKESFFELCDEKGILVWQEFPLACNNYEGTPHYLKILEQESTSIIKRLKRHPSLAIWCGGNELFNNWSLMTDQSAALRILNSQLMQGECYKCIYEEARRQKPYCSMAANWYFNEPWPTAANNNLISYPNNVGIDEVFPADSADFPGL